MAKILTQEEYDGIAGEKKPSGFKILSQGEYEEAMTDKPTVGDYLKAIPATGVDIAIGATEGLASAIGSATGDYDLARNIAEIRTDVNDSIMGDAPESVKSDFAYKLSSGLGSTLPYLAAAIVAKRGDMIAKVAANGFFLASAGQQVRDDYLGTQGVTSENATDEQMIESNKAGAIGAIPIALAEKLGAGMILRPFSKGPIPAGKVMERIAQYTSAGLGEAATEVTQSGIINGIAAYVNKYDKDRPITQGMAESAVIGFLVGGGVNAGIDTVNRAMTQSDRLVAGVRDGSINAKDVLDSDIGGPMAEIAMQNGSIPEAESLQQLAITNPNGFKDFASKVLTPLSRRLGRAGKEVVREFRKFELDTGVKLTEYKQAVNPFSKQMLELRKKSPQDYRLLSLALANANELATSLPKSVQNSLEQKAQIQPEVMQSSGEQLLGATNPYSQIINNQIEQARKSLSDRGLKTQFVVSESGNSFYDPSTDTISISATQADGSTVAHEYFHAILGQAVKTDVELQSMTRNMFDSVIRASVNGSSLNEQLKSFVSQYDTNIQNEEFLAQTVGELSRQYETLDINTKTRVKVWINQAMQALGMQGVFKQAETDNEVIEQLNSFARFAGDPEALTSSPSKTFKDGNEGAISAPISASKFQLSDLNLAPKINFSKKETNTSNIVESDSFDSIKVINEAINNNSNVVFWQSDQLGIGTYKSPLTGKEYDLDGGIGFAKSKIKGRNNFVWASTSPEAVRAASQADLVLMISGKPKDMHFFNKVVPSIIYDNVISKYGSVEKFTDRLSEASVVDAKLATKILEIHKKFNTRDKLIGSAIRKQFATLLSGRAYTKAGIPSDVKADLQELVPAPSDVTDSHLTNNNFDTRDIYGAFVPDGKFSDTNSHGTYGLGISGKFLGTPDRKLNMRDMLTDEYVSQFAEAERRDVEQKNIKKAIDAGLTADQAKKAVLSSVETTLSGIAGRQVGYGNVSGGAFVASPEQQIEEGLDNLQNQIADADQFERGSDALRKYQKERGSGQIANEEEIIRGLSDDGMAILQKYGMVDNYRSVRTTLDTIKEEYQSLGLDSNFIDNYFPRLVKDLDGLKKSFGMPTGIVDQEVARYENMTGQKLSATERQIIYEKLARSKLYRGGLNAPNNVKERRISLLEDKQLDYYASPELALDSYIEKMVNSIETKKLIGDSASGKTQGAEPVTGRLGEVMDNLASQGRLRQDQIDVIQGAVAARFGQHGRQYGFVKGTKNLGYLATMGNSGSALTQLGDFYFTMVQNGLIPTIESVMGKKEFTIADLGLAKDMVSIENEQGAGMFADSVKTVFKLTGLTAMDRLAKNTNINAAYKVMTRGAKAGQNTNKYKKTLARLKRTQGDDAYKTISDLKNGVKSDLVVEALYNELADVAPISLTEMPEKYADSPNMRIFYSLKSYTIKQFNFLRERTYVELTEGIVNKDPKRIGDASVNMMKILAFSALANGSADVLKAILFNREIDEEDFMWNTFLRMFGVTKYTAVVARNQGVGDALISFVAPPQFGIVNDITKDVADLNTLSEMRSSKYFPLAGKIYYWQAGKGVEVEERLGRLRESN